MPISTNAPFNEFGQSMILRDIEQLYLALNGAGTGSPGDGQTQDQSAATSQDSGGVPDLSGLATTTYVDQVAQDILSSIPTITYPISIANGGTGSSSAEGAKDAFGGLISTRNGARFTSGSSSWTVPSGVKRILCVMVGGGGGAAGYDGSTGNLGYIATSSGGSPTRLLEAFAYPGGGGSGGCAIVEFDVLPGDSVAYSVGSGGSGGTYSPLLSGSSGGNTTVTMPRSSTVLTVGGGGGGRAISSSTFGSSGGSPGSTVAYSAIPSTPDYLAVLWSGASPGGEGAMVIRASTTVALQSGFTDSSQGAVGYLGRGAGGSCTVSGGARDGDPGTGGLVAFFY